MKKLVFLALVFMTCSAFAQSTQVKLDAKNFDKFACTAVSNVHYVDTDAVLGTATLTVTGNKLRFVTVNFADKEDIIDFDDKIIDREFIQDGAIKSIVLSLDGGGTIWYIDYTTEVQVVYYPPAGDGVIWFIVD